jgi:competence protein ComEA
MGRMNLFHRHPSAIVGLCFASFFIASIGPRHTHAQNSGSAQNAGPIQSSAPSAANSAATDQKTLQAEFPDGVGKNTFLGTCSKCHSPENVIGHGQDANGWTQAIYKMIQYGAKDSNEDFGAIVYYLSHHFGPPPDKVDVNTATTMDLRNWLSFTKKQADAIAAYRKQHGDFKSIDDLKKVSGIDPKMIDADKGRLVFSATSPGAGEPSGS